MRSFVATAALAVCATGLIATPASAATVVYGFAWADGKGALRVLPRAAKPYTSQGYKLHKITELRGAKEVRLDYTGAAYRRVTTACDLVETEGRVAIDRNGLGKTACRPADLTASLRRGPVLVRVSYTGAKAATVHELLGGQGSQKTARGTIKRVNDTTITFTSGGKTVKLGYGHTMGFNRVTARCGDGWLSGRPVNADRDGLGTKLCDHKSFTKVLKGVRYPTLAVVYYSPIRGEVFEVTEVYGDA